MKIYKIFIPISSCLAVKPVTVDKKGTSLTNRSTEQLGNLPFKINGGTDFEDPCGRPQPP